MKKETSNISLKKVTIQRLNAYKSKKFGMTHDEAINELLDKDKNENGRDKK